MKIICNNNEIRLPTEIVQKILKFINDDDTYLNSRLVSREWYYYLKNIKKFKNFKVISITTFTPKLILTKDMENTIIKKIIFHNYGDYEIKYFENNLLTKKIIHYAPFVTEEQEFEYGFITSRNIVDIRNKKIKEEHFPLGEGCIIS